MSQPMFKIRSDEAETLKATANLLPCRIHHDGPVDTTEPFWKPTKSDGKLRTLGTAISGLLLTMAQTESTSAFFVAGSCMERA